MDTIPADQVVSVERDTFPGLLASGANIRAWQQSAYWIDVGTAEALVKCSADVVRGLAPSTADAVGPADQRILAGAVVANDANVHGGSTVGRGASVGPGADVDGSILMDGAVVGPGAQLRSSVLGHYASVGAGCVLRGCVIGDEAVVADGTELAPGTRLDPGAGVVPP
jgi:mannose-1-phosphate guanylyltransferase